MVCEEVTITRPLRLLHSRIPVYLVPHGQGQYFIGAAVMESDVQSNVSVRSLFELLAAAYHIHPAFGEARVIEIGGDARPMLLDHLPHVYWQGKVLCVNVLYRHGFLLSPWIAQVAALTILAGPAEDILLIPASGCWQTPPR